jgi:hypothetical protein
MENGEPWENERIAEEPGVPGTSPSTFKVPVILKPSIYRVKEIYMDNLTQYMLMAATG